MEISDPKALRKMKDLEKAISALLNRARREEKIQPAIAVFALIRVARLLVELHPENARHELLTPIVAYLRRDTVTVEGEKAPGVLLIH